MDALPKDYFLVKKTRGQSVHPGLPHFFYHDNIIPKWKKGKVPKPSHIPPLEEILDHYG